MAHFEIKNLTFSYPTKGGRLWLHTNEDVVELIRKNSGKR